MHSSHMSTSSWARHWLMQTKHVKNSLTKVMGLTSWSGFKHVMAMLWHKLLQAPFILFCFLILLCFKLFYVIVLRCLKKTLLCFVFVI